MEKKIKIAMNALTPKLDSIARCILRIESKKPFTLEELESNFDLQDIISTNMTRSIQLSVDIRTMILARSSSPIPAEMSECFAAVAQLNIISKETALGLKKSVGLRNIMILEYERIDWSIVHSVSTEHFGDIRAFCKSISSAFGDV